MNKKERLEKLFDEIEELRSYMYYIDEASDFRQENELLFLRDIIRYMAYGDEANTDSDSEDCDSEFRKIIYKKAKEKIDEFIEEPKFVGKL